MYSGKRLIVQELCFSNLKSFIKTRELFHNPASVAFIINQITKGLEYLHNQGMVHRSVSQLEKRSLNHREACFVIGII